MVADAAVGNGVSMKSLAIWPGLFLLVTLVWALGMGSSDNKNDVIAQGATASAPQFPAQAWSRPEPPGALPMGTAPMTSPAPVGAMPRGYGGALGARPGEVPVVQPPPIVAAPAPGVIKPQLPAGTTFVPPPSPPKN